MAAGAGFPRVLRNVMEAPVLLANLHGVYSEDSAFFEVAPNTLIIETVEPGEYCMSFVDSMMWPLSQGLNRDKLFMYLMGDVDPRDTPEEQKWYKDFAQNLTVYTPGTRIYNRHLKIGTTNDAFHNRMGFFKFDATSGYLYGYNPMIDGETHPSAVFKDLRKRLTSSADEESSYIDIISQFDAEYGKETPRIFFIISCGGTDIGLPPKERRALLTRIQQTVADARLKWKTYQTNPANAMLGRNIPSPMSTHGLWSEDEIMHSSAFAPHTSKVYQSQTPNTSFSQSSLSEAVLNVSSSSSDLYEVMVRKKSGHVTSAIHGFNTSGNPRIEITRAELLEMLISHADSRTFDQIVRIFSAKDDRAYNRDMIYLVRTHTGAEEPAAFLFLIDAKDRMKALRTELRALYRMGYAQEELEIHHTRKEYRKEDDVWTPLASYLAATSGGGRHRNTRKNRRGAGVHTRRRVYRGGVAQRK